MGGSNEALVFVRTARLRCTPLLTIGKWRGCRPSVRRQSGRGSVRTEGGWVFITETRRSVFGISRPALHAFCRRLRLPTPLVVTAVFRSEEHTSELQSPDHLVCRLLLEKKKNTIM